MKNPILQLLKADLNFIKQQKGRNGVLAGLAASVSPSFLCTIIYRLSHSLAQLRIPLLPRVFWWINFLLFKVDIDQRAKLYCALYMPHPIGIVIGRDTNMSGVVKIMQGATLGGSLGQARTIEGEGTMMTQPRIAGHCFIGINAIVVGPILLSGHIFISPNVLLAKDIEGDTWITQSDQRALLPAHYKELGIEQ